MLSFLYSPEAGSAKSYLPSSHYQPRTPYPLFSWTLVHYSKICMTLWAPYLPYVLLTLVCTVRVVSFFGIYAKPTYFGNQTPSYVMYMFYPAEQISRRPPGHPIGQLAGFLGWLASRADLKVRPYHRADSPSGRPASLFGRHSVPKFLLPAQHH
jgi:hypothetical protein